MNKKTVLLSLLFCWSSAEACTCSTPRSLSSEIAEYDNVFFARVTSKEKLSGTHADGFRYIFFTTDVLKGSPQKEYFYDLQFPISSCSESISIGQKWLVLVDGSGKSIDVGSCSPSRLIER